MKFSLAKAILDLQDELDLSDGHPAAEDPVAAVRLATGLLWVYRNGNERRDRHDAELATERECEELEAAVKFTTEDNRDPADGT